MDTGEQNIMGKPSQVIRFNKLTGQLEKPTLLLKTRGGKILGELQYTNLSLSFVGKGLNKLSFDVHKIVNGKECKCWDKLIDLCIIDYAGYGQFECHPTTDDSDETIKGCTCESLETELGQHTIRDMHINDEDAIIYGRKVDNDNLDFDGSGKFIPTVLYDKDDEDHSLLNRVLKEKAPHWTIGYVSPKFAVNGYVYDADQIQRTFTISNSSPYDFFDNEVSKEFGCIFTYDTYNRKVNCYNLEDCVYDKTTSKIIDGYYLDGIYYDENNNEIMNISNLGHCDGIGEDTSIFLSKSKLANLFSLDSDVGSIKNCFYVSGGDDEITKIVAAANVTGNNYIYLFGNFQYDDMSDELVAKIKEYSSTLAEKEKEFNKVGGVYVNNNIDYKYDTDKKAVVDKNGRIIINSKYINGFIYVLDTLAYYKNGKCYSRGGVELSSFKAIYDKPGLYTEYTNLVDRINYWEHTRFPNVEPSDTTAEAQKDRIIKHFVTDKKPIYIQNGCSSDSFAHVTSNIESMIGVICDNRYTVKVLKDDSHTITCDTIDKENTTGYWNGTISLTRDANEKDTIDFSLKVNVVLVYEDIDKSIEFCKQKIDIAIAKMDIVELDFAKLTDAQLKDLISQYNIASVKSFMEGFDSCRSTLDDLYANMGIESSQIPSSDAMLLSREKYTTRYNIAKEIYDSLLSRIDEMKSEKDILEKQISAFRESLDMKTFFGDILWKEFRSYVREDEYNNGNYISDGLTSTEILEKAKELLDVAKKELSKACMIQYTVSGDLNNIFSLDEKEKLHDKFAMFNYVRACIDDKIYKLRLMDISFSEDSPEKLNVTFSDQIENVSGHQSDKQKILEQTQAIATTYSSTTKQAKQGAIAMSNFNTLKQEGLDSSLYLIKNSNTEEVTFGNTGLSCKSMLDNGIYSPYELRATHNGIYLYDSSLDAVKTAVGRFKYNGEWVYGINTDVLIGNLIVGEKMLISNNNGSVEITGDGIVLDGGAITWTTNIDASNINSKGNTLDKVISDYDDSIIEITNNINELDDRVQTYSQDKRPDETDLWKPEEYESHLGDIWFDTANNLTKIWTKNGDNYEWAITEDANLKALATQKSTIYRTTTAPNKTTYPELKSGDLWVLPADTTIGDNTYKKDTILIYNGSSWTTTTTDSAEDALSQLSDISKDGLLTPTEKVQLQYTITDIKSEYLSVCAEAKEYSIDYADFDTAYNNLIAYITPLLSDMSKTDEIVSSTFDGYFNEYYSKRNSLTETINSKIGENLSKALSDAKQGINDAAKALNEANSAYSRAENAESNAKGHADSQDKILSANLTDAYQQYSNTAVSNFDKAVAEYLQVPGATTIIGGNHVISPYIEGGYLNITNGNKQVIVDPSNKTETGYIFAVKNGNEFTVGIKADGTTNIKAHLTALSLDLDGNKLKSSDIYDLNDTIQGYGYQTDSQTRSIIEAYGYQTSGNVKSIVTSYGYQDANEVKSIVEGYGYTTNSAAYQYLLNGNYFLVSGTELSEITGYTEFANSLVLKSSISSSVKKETITTPGGVTKERTVYTTTIPNSDGTSKTFHTYDDSSYVLTNIGIGNGSSDPSSSTSTDTYVMIDKNGCLTADNAVIRGSIYAINGYFSGELRSPKGTFGGWTIKDTSIYSDALATDNYVRRAYIQSMKLESGETAIDAGEKWVFSVQKATTEGSNPINFNAIWKVNGNGDMYSTGKIECKGEIICGSDITTDGKLTVKGNGLELYFKTPYIDFHYENASEDFTSRIIEESSGSLSMYSNLTVTKNMTTNGTIGVLGTGDAVYSYFSGKLSVGTNAYVPGYDFHVNGTTYTSGIIVTNQYFKSEQCITSTTTAEPNCYIDTLGTFFKTSNTSSKRFKDDVTTELCDELNPNNLYDVDVVQFKYKKDYFTNKHDTRYRKDLIGFVAEDIYEKYPIAADYHYDDNGDVVVDGWNKQYMIPAMLKLIQEQKKEIDKLKETINNIK